MNDNINDKAGSHIYRLRLAAYGVAVLLVATLIGGGVIGVIAANDFTTIQNNWKHYNETVEAKGFRLNQMRHHFGYGGFIHAFKNYVLRQDNHLLKNAKYHLQELYRTIREYEAISVNKQETAALKNILKVIGDYQIKLNIANQSVAMGRSPVEIDKLVKVNDAPALAAMAALEQIWMIADKHANEELNHAVVEGQTAIHRAFLFIPVVIASILLMILLLRHLVREIAERTAAEAALHDSETRIRAVIENIVDAIITINEAGIIKTFNKGAANIFNYSPKEAIGQNIKMLMPESGRNQHDEHLKNYIITGKKKLIGTAREVEGQRKNGSIFSLDLAVSEMWLNNKRMFVAIARDISERKEVERMKSEFVSTVSHELRTPLTSIQGSLTLIAQADLPGLTDKYKKLISIAHKNSGRLVRLINDILDIEKIKSGSMTFKLIPQTIMALAEQAIEANQSFAQQFKVKIILNDSLPKAMIKADSDRIIQVFTNLLSNAAKFSPTGGTVNVSIKRFNGNIRTEVSDQGNGIPEEFRDKIFGKFSQADASDTRKCTGTGLGLNISRAIIENHDGHIGFDTQTGGGTTFFFELSEWREKHMAPETNALTTTKPKVLYIEDDHDLIAVVSSSIGEDVELQSATSLEMARKKLQSEQFDIILLDIGLHDGSGLDLIDELYRPDGTSIPVVLFTAHDVSDDIAKRVADVLIKAHTSMDRLADTLFSAINLNRSKNNK